MDKLGIDYEMNIRDNCLEGTVAPKLLQSSTQKIIIHPIQWPEIVLKIIVHMWWM